MNFGQLAIFVAAAIVFHIFEKIAVFAAPFGTIDVLTLNIEYGIRIDWKWHEAFLNCTNDVFRFGPDKDKDSRFAFACSKSVLYWATPIIEGIDYSKYVQLWNRTLPNVEINDYFCDGVRQYDRAYNFIDKVLLKYKEYFGYQHRNSSSVVTIVFVDEYFNNDILSPEAKWFVKWPNQIYLAIQRDITCKEHMLAKRGIARSHLLKFSMGNCPDLVTVLQRLMCRGEPNTGPCEPTPDPDVCYADVLSYKGTPLLHAETICNDALIVAPGEKITCDCPDPDSTAEPSTNSSTTYKTDSGSTEAYRTAAKLDNQGFAGGTITSIVLGLLVVLLVIGWLISCFMLRKKSDSSKPVGAEAEGDGSQRLPSRCAGGNSASSKAVLKPQKSVSKPHESVSKCPITVLKQPQKSPKSVPGDQSKVGGGTKKVKSRMGKK